MCYTQLSAEERETLSLWLGPTAIRCVVRSRWDVFGDLGAQATDHRLAVRSPKAAFAPPQPLEMLLSHSWSCVPRYR